jgi:flagellar hook-length control protein FliK
VEPAGPEDGGREGKGAEDEGAGRTASRPLENGAAGAPEAAGDDGAAPPERFDMGAREARSTHSGDIPADRHAEAAGRVKEAPPGALRQGVFDQIVQRAVVQVAGEVGEIKIDLKPDFLGQVRMQIVTENQQVSVRILTELPAVRDMIEAGLHQLRSELQSQGLQVARVEVSVTDDYRQHSWRRGKHGTGRKTGGVTAAGSADDASGREGLDAIAAYRRQRAAGRGGVDMFA